MITGNAVSLPHDMKTQRANHRHGDPGPVSGPGWHFICPQKTRLSLATAGVLTRTSSRRKMAAWPSWSGVKHEKDVPCCGAAGIPSGCRSLTLCQINFSGTLSKTRDPCKYIQIHSREMGDAVNKILMNYGQNTASGQWTKGQKPDKISTT
jgi:hypothetical protein